MVQDLYQRSDRATFHAEDAADVLTALALVAGKPADVTNDPVIQAWLVP